MESHRTNKEITLRGIGGASEVSASGGGLSDQNPGSNVIETRTMRAGS
jgi:hypothetical protein